MTSTAHPFGVAPAGAVRSRTNLRPGLCRVPTIRRARPPASASRPSASASRSVERLPRVGRGVAGDLGDPAQPVAHGVGVHEQQPGGRLQRRGLLQERRQRLDQRRARRRAAAGRSPAPAAGGPASSPASARSGSRSSASTGRGASGQAGAAQQPGHGGRGAVAGRQQVGHRRADDHRAGRRTARPVAGGAHRVDVRRRGSRPAGRPARRSARRGARRRAARRISSTTASGSASGVLPDDDDDRVVAAPARAPRPGTAASRRPRRAAARRRPATRAGRPTRRGPRPPARRPGRRRTRSRGSSAAPPRARSASSPGAICSICSSTTAMTTRTSSTVCCRVTDRVSSRGAVPNTSALIACGASGLAEPLDEGRDAGLGDQVDPGPVLRRHRAVPRQHLVHPRDRGGGERAHAALEAAHGGRGAPRHRGQLVVARATSPTGRPVVGTPTWTPSTPCAGSPSCSSGPARRPTGSGLPRPPPTPLAALPADEVAARAGGRHAHRAQGRRPEDRRGRRAGRGRRVPDYLATLEAAADGPVTDGGAALRAAAARRPAHPLRLVRRRQPDRGDGPRPRATSATSTSCSPTTRRG